MPLRNPTCRRHYLATHRKGSAAYRRDAGIGPSDLTSWSKLEKACIRWEEVQHISESDSTGLFFEFPRSNPENFNCLFLTIIFSFKPTEYSDRNTGNSLAAFLKDVNLVEAGRIYWRLCRKGWRLSEKERIKVPLVRDIEQPSSKKDTTFSPLRVRPDAVVWHHWYTTLNQMLSEMDIGEQQKIVVIQLPGGHTIAGEWFLGLPSYSAAPEAGLQLIRLLTTREAEMNRLHLGVGLPTRESFYQEVGAAAREDVSPYFRMSLETIGRLLTSAHQRSKFAGYSRVSGILTHNLKRVLSIPDGTDSEVEALIRRIMVEMEQELKFVESPKS